MYEPFQLTGCGHFNFEEFGKMLKYFEYQRSVVNFKLGEEMRNDVINMSWTRDKEKKSEPDRDNRSEFPSENFSRAMLNLYMYWFWLFYYIYS